MCTVVSLALSIALILYPFRSEGATVSHGPAAPGSATAWLRLARGDYATSDCLSAVLQAPGLSVPPGVAPPALRLGAILSGDHEAVLMNETGPGVFGLAVCLSLGTGTANADDGVLQVQAGDQIAAAVRNDRCDEFAGGG